MEKRNAILIVIATLLFSLLVVACGSRPQNNETSSGDGSSASSGSGGIAAMPTANFKSVASQSAITITTNSEASAEDVAAALVLGERVYQNKCSECHGLNGSGTDSAAAVAGTELAFAEFEDLLRTGGDIGPEHLFGMRAVSANGMAGLHAYLAAAE